MKRYGPAGPTQDDWFKTLIHAPGYEMSCTSPRHWPDDLDAHEASVDADALAVAATEYAMVEAEVEPFWKALLGIVCVFVIVAALAFVMYGFVS